MPVTLTRLIVRFAPVFSKRVWEHARLLVVGALLAPGTRTVTAVLRVMGLSQEGHFQTYHRVLNRARWSSLALARVLLEMVVRTFVPQGPVVIGIDDTLERRRGEKITAKGIYRDPVRSSHAHVVKASGLRWLCAMVRQGADRGRVGGARVGLTVSDCLVSLGTLSPAAGPPPQDLAGVGRATPGAAPPLAAAAGGRGGSR